MVIRDSNTFYLRNESNEYSEWKVNSNSVVRMVLSDQYRLFRNKSVRLFLVFILGGEL